MTPLRFKPLIKQIRWGGTRLGSVLRKDIGAETDYAESWEFSDHGSDQSVVVGGPYNGLTLNQLVQDHNAELFGRHAGLDQFPLLVKFLDASDNLSVQVHPDDDLASLMSPGENGKTESWTIIDSQLGSRIYAGLKEGIDAVELQEHLEAGTVEECLHSFEVSAGDCVFVPAGTVHAIGKGILLAEVQQMSNTTYRMYDWGRMGSDGKPRELHVSESLRCIDFARGPLKPVTPRSVAQFHESADRWFESEELIACPYFVLQRHKGTAPFPVVCRNSFHALTVLNGECSLVSGSESQMLTTGDSVLIPATCEECQIVPNGKITLLDAFLPAEYSRRSTNGTTSMPAQAH
jgi:mannose-6-phosphate isomerase